MSKKENGNLNSQSAKVIQLGFNISVSGNPDTDFQVVLDDKVQGVTPPALQSEAHIQPAAELQGIQDDVTNNNSNQKTEKHQQSLLLKSTETAENSPHGSCLSATDSSKPTENSKGDSSTSKELSLINDIKHTVKHFERFSDRIKECPRFRSRPIATSTPYPDRQNSKSEPSLLYPEIKHKRFNSFYDFNYRSEYFKGSMKPLPPDLYLKPLPGENLYKRGIVARYFDYEPFRYYGSVDSLTKSNDDYNYCSKNYNADKYESESSSKGILKKSDSESGDKQSTSSAESVKDIKIYQSGGILIMQNFKEGFDMGDKKNISDLSATLIENCKKLNEEMKNDFANIEEKSGSMNSSDEGKHVGKMVQFDLSECENQKSKSSELPSDSPIKIESSESASDCLKIKDSSPQGTLQSQDFQSISTQENDSIISNPPGTSPGASSKKLEWDSGADVGYLNLDLSQENLSSIERIVLRGLASDGRSEKKVVYEKRSSQPHSKFVLERLPSNLVIEEIVEEETVKKDDSDMENFKKNKVGKNMATEVKTLEDEDPDCTKEKIKKGGKIPVEGSDNLNSGIEEDCFEGLAKLDKSSAFKHVESSDKCVSVNTLFNDFVYPLPVCWGSGGSGEPVRNVSETSCKFRSSRLPSKTKKLKKKSLSHRSNLTAPLKDKIESIIDIARHSSRSVDSDRMGVPKKIYRKVEANPQLNELELSREVEEIIIDQRFKIKQNLAVEREPSKEEYAADIENESKKVSKKKNKPISASSSSNNTAKMVDEAPKEKEKIPSEEIKGIDQMVQTCKSEVESIGIQAFSSQKSSLGEVKHSKEKKTECYRVSKDNVTSKNIQVFGLNSSLPKQLAHPKETKLQNAQNTKSTQFFGGPINSLPNYHCKITAKPVESCNHFQKEPKINKNIERDLTRLQEKNVKNILGEENIPKDEPDEPNKNVTEKQGDIENKENLTKSGSKGRTSISQKISAKNDVKSSSQKVIKNLTKNDSHETKKKTRLDKDNLSQNYSNDVNTSDEVSSKILTSEVLKEHGSSIDRNIIKEKYFQSQLDELEKREMISKGTSMERLFEEKRDELACVKENVSVGCQYSPQSKGNSSDEGSKSPEHNPDTDRVNTISQRREGSNQYDSSQNLMEEEQFEPSKVTNPEQEFGSGDSCPSSTQTAHSWVPGNQDPEQNKKSVIGRARSFEYLPGHIYECSGNLREELPSDVEPNITTGSSSSSGEGNGANHSSSDNDEGKLSEGRKTLVLENSNDASCDSDRMKSLNENLTELDVVVEKLRKKDAEIQNITQSLLVKFWKTNGSGDCADVLANPSTPRKLEINYTPIDDGSPKDSGDSSSKTRTFDKSKKEKEISIACQTEGKSSPLSQKTFSGERKALESRIAAEKESQIKWIENEINHLNILRNLLEKQNKSTERKQKSSDVSRSDEKDFSKNSTRESHPQSVELDGELILSHKDNELSNENVISTSKAHPPSLNGNEVLPLMTDTNYGMAVSLVGRVRKVMMFPIGVEFNVNDPELRWRCSASSDADSDIDQRHPGRPWPYVSRYPKPEVSNNTSRRQHPCQDYTEYSHPQMNTSRNVNTQFPSVERAASVIGPSQTISVQTDFSVSRKCKHCHQEVCVCLSLSKSDKSEATASGLSKENTNSTERREALKMNFMKKNQAADHKTASGCTTPEIVEIVNCSKNSNEHSRASNNERRISSVCKCENCPKRSCSGFQRSGIIYAPSSAMSQNPCPSNIYVTCEKTNDIALSGCSKVHIEKSSNCACHVIKIHDCKCCSYEGRSSSKRRNLIKTESQASQTEAVIVDRKNLITKSELVKPPKAPEVKCQVESKVGIEKRHSVVKKFPYKPKVSVERRHPCSPRLQVKEKYAVPEELSNGVQDNCLRSEEISACKCHKNRKRGEMQVDDHPRHYFLKIEEKEVDDSNESLAIRPTLDVITVTVPVKRVNKSKSKVAGNKHVRSYASNQCSLESMESYKKNGGGGCNCCERCIGRYCEQISLQYETQLRGEYRKTKAEKPSSPNGNERRYAKEIKSCSYEEVLDCGESSSKDLCVNRQSSSSQEYYHQKETINSLKSDSYFSRSASGYSVCQNGFQQLDKRNECGEQIDYDSHKKYSNVNSYWSATAGNEEDRPREAMREEKRYQYPCEPDKSNQHFEDRFQSDYYNYDKKEFMTRSEMQREEMKKKKVQQPSLQEYLESNRPDFYNNAENRRYAISQRAKEREKKKKLRMECLMNVMHQCNGSEPLKNIGGSRRIFTTSQMKEQTMKLYRNLPEVTGKIADQRKRDEYRTNKLMADVFAKKLQIEALKGHINLSNSFSVLSTI